MMYTSLPKIKIHKITYRLFIDEKKKFTQIQSHELVGRTKFRYTLPLRHHIVVQVFCLLRACFHFFLRIWSKAEFLLHYNNTAIVLFTFYCFDNSKILRIDLRSVAIVTIAELSYDTKL